jgi:hypothetical protein
MIHLLAGIPNNRRAQQQQQQQIRVSWFQGFFGFFFEWVVAM